jgi:spermidine synthase
MLAGDVANSGPINDLELRTRMPWTEIEQASLDGRPLTLHRGADGAWMIRVDGLELMNSRQHRSEDQLGAVAGGLAVDAADDGNPRLLIGGLGLGFTLAAATRALGGRGRIDVAEISSDVIAWYERYVEPAIFARRPAGIRLLHCDVAACLGGAVRYDAILLDVDNGPRALATAGNDDLYGAQGLAALERSITERGVALVWSGFEAPEFAARAQDAGFRVACRSVTLPERADLHHYIYELRRD